MFWNAQCSGSFKAERSRARKDAMPCPRALRQSSCFPAWTDILRFQQAESSWSENPHRHWHWVRFCFFFFAFLMQAVAKNCRAPKIHMRDICSSTAGDAELFQVNSTSWGTSDQKKNPHLKTPKKMTTLVLCSDTTVVNIYLKTTSNTALASLTHIYIY